MMEKDQRKSNLKLIFQENAQKCMKMTKQSTEKSGRHSEMSALTSEMGLVCLGSSHRTN